MEGPPQTSKEHRESLPLSFRKATPEDVDVFVALEQSVMGAKTYSGVDTEEEALREFAENEVYLIYKDGALVGNAAYQMKTPNHAYISGLVIHPNAQRQGIGREAMLFLLEKLKDVQRIDLVTHPENERSLALYTSLGFIIEKRIENYYGDGEPRVVLAKESSHKEI